MAAPEVEREGGASLHFALRAAAVPALWLKVVPLAPSTAVLDIEYDLLECAFPADVRALKVAAIAARGSKLKGVAPEDLRVHFMGSVRPAAAAERELEADAALAPDSELRCALGVLPKAFFIVAAALPAGACAIAHSLAPCAPSSRPPFSLAVIGGFGGGGAGGGGRPVLSRGCRIAMAFISLLRHLPPQVTARSSTCWAFRFL